VKTRYRAIYVNGSRRVVNGKLESGNPAFTKKGLREKLWVKVAQVLIKVPEACKSKP
jgi:hypothetical protein